MKTTKPCVIALSLWFLIGCSSTMPGGSGSNPTPSPSGSSSSVSIVSLSPASVSVGSPDVLLTINGSGFPANPSAREDHPAVFWNDGTTNGQFLAVADADTIHVTATIPASLLTRAATISVQVQIYHFADDTPKAVSNVLDFKITN